MPSTFKSNDIQISEILRQIDDGSVQLPDFQRGWVWDDYRIRALIASIINAYPVGALMFLGYGGDTIRFKYRPFTGAHVDCEPEQLVLDGQQRLTSIYNALYCKTPVDTRNEKGADIKRFYYLDINKCLDESVDMIDAILAVPEDRKIRSDFGRNVDVDLSTPQLEYEHLLFPLNAVFDTAAWITWMNECKAFHGYDSNLTPQLDKFQADVLVEIQQYKVPVIQLAKETSKEAVCQVFENVNTGGVALTVFELVTASFAADDYDLRGDWEGSSDDSGRKGRLNQGNPLLADVTSTDFLTAATLLIRYHAWRNGGLAVSCKKRDVLNIEREDYERYADALEHGFIDAAHFLNEQRIFSARDLPYSTQLIPLAVLFTILGARAKDATVQSKLSRWYWCGVLGEMYGGANETRYVTDVIGMLAWIDGGDKLPDTVGRAYFQPTRLLTLQTRLSAAYKGIMALILKNGAVDFMTGQAMDFVNFTDQGVDIHHIFPAAYCRKQHLPKRKWNSIVNKTPITAHTNRVVGGSAPSSYMRRIERNGHVTQSDLDDFMRTHCVDVDALRGDDFDAFFIDRACSLLDLIAGAMGKEVPNRSGDDVVEQFGQPLE